jgi:hypothetical protein
LIEDKELELAVFLKKAVPVEGRKATHVSPVTVGFFQYLFCASNYIAFTTSWVPHKSSSSRPVITAIMGTMDITATKAKGTNNITRYHDQCFGSTFG